MTIARVLRGSSIVSLLFGAPLLILPAFVLGIYGISTSGPTEFVARILGGQLLGFALLDWRASSADDATRRQVNTAVAVAEAGSLIGSLIAIGGAGGNALVWGVPLIFAAFLGARIVAAR